MTRGWKEPPIKRASYLIGLIGLVSVAEPCAWVLWVEIVTIGSTNDDRTVTPSAAYDQNGAQECFEDAHTRATSLVEDFKTAANVKNVKRTMGSKEHIEVELKRGGTQYWMYACFPHPVKPE